MRLPRLAALTAALVVLPPAAAFAHPSFNPNAVPIGEPVETVLVVPHGCSTGDAVMPEEGQEVPTTRFDLQLLDGITVELGEIDGWTVEDDGEAIVWTADGGATADPIEFPVTLTVSEGAAGDQLEIAALQECEDGSTYRWTSGSDSTPPVRLELTEGETSTVDHGDGGHGTDMGSETPSETATATATPSETVTTAPPTEQASELDGEAAADASDGGNGSMAAVIGALVVLLAAGGTLVARRRGNA